MTDNPDAKATTAIKTAIRDFETQFDGGVSFGRFKIAVAPARAFTAIWWTEIFIGGGPLGNPVTFYKYNGGGGTYLPLGDVVATQSKESWDRMGSWQGKSMPVPGGGVMLFASSSGVFAHPTGFTRIADDSGSGNSNDVVYYRMNPPNGYVALGICFTNGDPPDPNNYWCVDDDYVRAVGSVSVWSDTDAHWTSCNGSLHAPSFDQQTPSPDSNEILILPPTYLSDQDSANERGYALVGQQAMLTVSAFDPPDPPSDTTIMSGATTTYGLGPVAIVPYTAVPADAWFGNGEQAISSPFYYIASEPYWKCTRTLPSSAGGMIEVNTTIGVSDTQASAFTHSTSMTIGCSVGAGFGGLSAQVSASYTQAFSLSTSESATQSSSTTTQTQVNFPKQANTWIWDRQTQIAIFRMDGSLVSTASYGCADRRFVPPGATT